MTVKEQVKRWSVTEDGYRIYDYETTAIIAVTAHNQRERTEDAKMRARLIAAAPELLGILKELSAITRAYIAEGVERVDSAIWEAEKTIAKAEGK